jgi:hypothetical protein
MNEAADQQDSVVEAEAPTMEDSLAEVEAPTIEDSMAEVEAPTMEDTVAEIEAPTMEDTVAEVEAPAIGLPGRGRGAYHEDSWPEIGATVVEETPVPGTEAMQATESLEEAIAEPADHITAG